MAMSSNDKRDSVTFVWAIENLLEDWFGKIESPVIWSDSLYNTAWKMILNPIGNDDTSISLGLERCGSEDNGTESIVLDFELSIVDEEGSPLKRKKIEKHVFRRGHSWSCERFVERIEVFTTRKYKYIPHDTLTVGCRLRRSFNEDTEAEVRFSRTRIEKLCFFWTIEDFCYLKSNQRKKLHLKRTDSETPLTFEFVVEKGEVQIDVTSTVYRTLHFLCYTSLIDKFGEISKDEGTWFSFKLPLSDWNPTTRVWGPKVTRLSSFLNKGFLCSKKNLYLPMGVLSMRVECYFWTGNADSNNDNIQQIQTYRVIDETKIGTPLAKVRETDVMSEYTSDSFSRSRYMHDLQCMFEEGILSDLIIRSSNKDFPVHKNILSARSPVFRAMFTTAMREKESNSIEIPDVNAETLERMLLYVYLNRIDKDMQWESAMNLYVAADKYAIEELKQATCSLLKTGLCVSNSCEILVLADLHGYQDLKSITKDFIIDNDSKVIGSDDWNKLLKSNINLAVEIFSELYVKKMKR